jgi:hypothetical protein
MRTAFVWAGARCLPIVLNFALHEVHLRIAGHLHLGIATFSQAIL